MENNGNPDRIFNARTIGAFFLLAFFAYGSGRNLFESADNTEKYIGALMIIANSAMVMSIGILFRKTLGRYNPLTGNIYLYTRIFEALALASLVFTSFFEINISDDAGYFLGMLVLGLGSIPMCLTLHKHSIAPSWLAIWGVAGYAILSSGFLLELFGMQWSMYFLGPGGLWEIVFALWLIIRGGQNVKIREER